VALGKAFTNYGWGQGGIIVGGTTIIYQAYFLRKALLMKPDLVLLTFSENDVDDLNKTVPLHCMALIYSQQSCISCLTTGILHGADMGSSRMRRHPFS